MINIWETFTASTYLAKNKCLQSFLTSIWQTFIEMFVPICVLWPYLSYFSFFGTILVLGKIWVPPPPLSEDWQNLGAHTLPNGEIWDPPPLKRSLPQ